MAEDQTSEERRGPQGGAAMSGASGGSNTRAGTLEGGAAPGAPDESDETSMAGAVGPQAAGLGDGAEPEGQGAHAPQTTPEPRAFDAGEDPATAAQTAVNNTGLDPMLGPKGDPAEGKRGEGEQDADAATG